PWPRASPGRPSGAQPGRVGRNGLEAQGIRRLLPPAHQCHLHRTHAQEHRRESPPPNGRAARHARMSPRRSDARKRMLDAASTLVRERGASATSLDDILAHSQAPRGSVYYYFPGGRTQLIEEALERAGEDILQFIAGDGTPAEVFAAFIAAWRDG